MFSNKTLQGTYRQHNPAMIYGSMVDSLVSWYPYSGEDHAKTVVRGMLDCQLTHGITPVERDWAGVSFATVSP